MKTDKESKADANRVSRRELLGKSAKYAALIPVSTLVATKASAHTFSGTDRTECGIAFNGGSQPSADNHCVTASQHPNLPPV